MGQNGVEDLTTTIGISNFYVTAMSSDGSVLAGVDWGKQLGFVWNQGQGVRYLAAQTGQPEVEFYPKSISSDGKTVVGFDYFADTGPVVWTQATGVEILRDSQGDFFRRAAAHDVSSDGTVVVGGKGGSGSGYLGGAWIFDATHGVRDLNQLLINDFGLAASLVGWNLKTATGISADGRTIVGVGSSPRGIDEAWIAYLGVVVPEPSTLVSLVAFSCAVAFTGCRVR